MRVIHNNLQAGEQRHQPSVMDKLRNNFNQLCPLLRARYRKLLDDYASSKENIPLLIQSPEYVSYSCSCCGRTQKLQVSSAKHRLVNEICWASGAYVPVGLPRLHSVRV